MNVCTKITLTGPYAVMKGRLSDDNSRFDIQGNLLAQQVSLGSVDVLSISMAVLNAVGKKKDQTEAVTIGSDQFIFNSKLVIAKEDGETLNLWEREFPCDDWIKFWEGESDKSQDPITKVFNPSPIGEEVPKLDWHSGGKKLFFLLLIGLAVYGAYRAWR